MTGKSFLFVLICLWSEQAFAQKDIDPTFWNHAQFRFGGLERADTTQQIIYLMFTGGDYNDGRKKVPRFLKKKKVKAHFFFTGDFYRLPENKSAIRKLKKHGHYLGAHSDKHLLYAAWENRDSLLVTKEVFRDDLLQNYDEMAVHGISESSAPYFMPPYEWYNQQISDWTTEMGLQLINFTPGTRSNADYTTPKMGKIYISSDEIYQRILDYESNSSAGLNGFLLLIHIGTHPDRTDKFYDRLPELIEELRSRGYRFSLLPTGS